MFNKTKRKYYTMGAAITVGFTSSIEGAYAAAGGAAAGGGGGSGNSFSTISKNITTQIQDIPGLISALAYLFGMLLAVLGIMKIKDHVENPTQTPLKDGAIRLLAGGALFALPIILESMTNALENDGSAADTVSATVKKVQFNVN